MEGVKQANARIRSYALSRNFLSIFVLAALCLMFGRKYCSQMIARAANSTMFSHFIKKCLMKVLSCKNSSLIFIETVPMVIDEQVGPLENQAFPPPVLNGWSFSKWPKFKFQNFWDHRTRSEYTNWASTRKLPDAYFEDVKMLQTKPFKVVIHFDSNKINVPKGKYTCLNVWFEQVLVRDEHWNDKKTNFHISLVIWDRKTNAYTEINDEDKQFLCDTFFTPVTCLFSVHVSTGGCIFLDTSTDPQMQHFLAVVRKSNRHGAHISLD